MGTYASTSDITSGRLVGRTIDASSKPTLTQVGQWITEGEAILTGALNAVGITTPITNANGIEIMKQWACDYCEARVRMAWVAAGGDGNTDGELMLKRFDDVINAIQERPSFYESMLRAGDGDASVRVLGYVLDNDDDKTIADGDFDPAFDEDTEF